MMEERRLKRGLKDISPLFQSEAAGPVQTLEPSLEIVSVFSPDRPHDPLFFNRYLASQLTGAGQPCSILSIRSKPAADASVRSVTWEEFREICRRPLHRSLSDQFNRAIFLDFDYARESYVEKIMPLLNKWVVVLELSMESLNEAYKMMKGIAPLNRHLQLFVLFAGEAPMNRAELLFERFSEMVSRRLGLDLVWLGSVPVRPNGYPLSEAARETLLAKPAGRFDSPEKISLARFFQ